MTIQYSNLPGGCFVNRIKSEAVTPHLNGMFISAELLEEFGFEPQRKVTMLIRQGQIIISTNPEQENLFNAIEELQMRQDELKRDFAPAIQTMLQLV